MLTFNEIDRRITAFMRRWSNPALRLSHSQAPRPVAGRRHGQGDRQLDAAVLG
jgi:hypothetical protein